MRFMSERLADDLIVGTARIGDEIGRTRRQAQHLIDTREIPAFKLAGKWATRRSTLRKLFDRLEQAAAAQDSTGAGA
jgi:hypothetical protein